jgi:hypothetical protein
MRPPDPTGGLLGLRRAPVPPELEPRASAKPARIPKPKQAPGPSVTTTRGRVLAALAMLSGAHTPEGVVVASVVLSAWSRWPEHFSLAQGLAHPCSNAVCSRLADPEVRPFIERPTTGRVRLSELGRKWWEHAALELRAPPGAAPSRPGATPSA